ncbi:FMN-dependent NADH-azoreductase [Zestomonas carbonaria]|uniref:FMN dependent NADH:quinone oxidoreductase n=1 Tax=Zestomonas carbonaria TaxID=2762745 RepID=A0A7U7EMG8_9GAMM|nr:NAD(P)H-dependent oxidoreductase [Pseudomonas carbonaria]CAD5107670.1 FMN-dependent NADH-azoreductase [Pseudomonas carbonaria]
MRHILLLECSPHGQRAHGSRLVRQMADCLRQRHPQARLIERDLGRESLPPLDAAYARAITSTSAMDDPAFALSERLIDELERSDCLLIAAPMHNFTVPATLKLWIDHVLRIHRSFAATPEGKVGLLADRPTFVVVSAGGFYRGERARQPDFLSPYLRHVLATIGIHEVEFVHLQGLTQGPEQVGAALAEARRQLRFSPHFPSLSPLGELP